MSDAVDPKEGLAALLADVLSEGAPDPELLVRYADDPSALSPEARQIVESRLAESPQVRDQLNVLKRFDFPVEQPSEEKSNAWLAEALGRIRRLFESRPLLVGMPAIAVAALALLLIYPSAFSIFRPDRASEPASEFVPELLADERILDQIPATPTVRVRDSIVIAATMPAYRVPQGATPRLRSGVRGVYSDASYHLIMALAPEHVGQTASDAPFLYWYLFKIPEVGGFEFFFGSVDVGSVPGQSNDTPVGEVSDTWIPKDLPSPNQPGLQRILLSDYGVELETGVDYSWTVSFGSRAYANGWIKRVEPPASVAKRLAEGSLGEAPAIYAEAGLWYDALSSLLELVSDHPNNESLRTARLELLRQGGLEAVDEALAEHER